MADFPKRENYSGTTEFEDALVAYWEAEGHTPRCARRIVWGDGECECNLKGDVASRTRVGKEPR